MATTMERVIPTNKDTPLMIATDVNENPSSEQRCYNISEMSFLPCSSCSGVVVSKILGVDGKVTPLEKNNEISWIDLLY